MKFIRVIAILLAVLAAVFSSGCGGEVPDPAPATDASSETEALTEPAENDSSDFIIAEDGKPLCALVTAENASSEERALAAALKVLFRNTYGFEIESKVGAGAAEEREIVIGCYVPGVDEDAYGFARYGLWGIGRSGSKLLIYSLDAKSYSTAMSLVQNYINRSSDEKTVKLSKEYFSTEERVRVRVPIPAAGGTAAAYVQHTGGTDTAKKCSSVSFKGVSESFFTDYLSKLESLSYEKKFENSISGNKYVSFVKDGEMLTVDWFPTMRIMRVISEPAYETPVWDLPSGKRTAAVKLFQIEDTTAEHASCFIVTLADGRYLLYDTGLTATADQAHDYMQKNNRFTDGKIHIAAIVISHPHTDHMDGLSAYANKYAGDTVCDAVMYNLVSVDMQKVLSTDTLNSRQNSFNDAAKKLGATVYCLRGGQKFTLSGTDFEVLFTADELGDFALTGVDASGNTDTTYDMNNSSLILRMTESGQTTVFTGDCRGGEAGIISEMFSRGFQADMMTVAHHGFNVVATLWMYKTAKPKVLFWTIKTDKSDTSRSFVKQLMAADYVIKHFYEDSQVEITLPYTPER